MALQRQKRDQVSSLIKNFGVVVGVDTIFCCRRRCCCCQDSNKLNDFFMRLIDYSYTVVVVVVMRNSLHFDEKQLQQQCIKA
jgi:hypothetical protein